MLTIHDSDVSQFIDRLHAHIRTILGDTFVGMYVYGSLALGDFDAARSDIDVLVVTVGTVSDVTLSALHTMHDHLHRWEPVWGSRVDVCYMPRAVLVTYHTRAAAVPCVSSVSPFGPIALGKDWILNRWILREQGLIVDGPDPKDQIAPISAADLHRAVRDLLCSSWSQYVDGATWMHPRKYQAFTVLTMCRALYALETGALVSKFQAAHWCKVTLGDSWRPVIDEALRTQADATPGDMTSTLRFLRFVVSTYCSEC